MKVCVIGTGYVGLTTGAVFADLGNEVVCVDNIKEKIDMLNKGIMPIYEPGLEEMVHRNKKDGRLIFTTDIAFGVKRSEVIFIAVGTPPKPNGETDLSQVEAAAIKIAQNLDSYKVIVNKSTVPIGTGDFVRQIIEANRKKNVDFDVVSNPEFLKEGSAINDTLNPDRIVIGAPSQNVAMKLLELYAPLERPMLITDVYSAEMIKYASNAFLATKISFINAIANICEKAGADVTDVIKGVGADSRIGHAFLQAGLGYGGSCFPKDVESLIHTSSKFGEEFKLLKSVVEINKMRVPRFIQRMKKELKSMKGKTIAILGLAFKPNTDDLREAKSLEVIRLLLDEGAKIQAYDPIAIENCKKIFPKLKYCNNAYDAAKNADALVIVTEWNEFKFLALDRLKEVMKQPIIFDGRNLLDPKRVRATGFKYFGVGR
ncbi:MAG: UDP-glucose/GDP-mannose dehydrogenase family protein [bacterium]|nr:UDP-glucose/GDP-mannose dehydrogenase family protein [bacterium]